MNQVLSLLVALGIPGVVIAETVKDREGAVRGDREAMEDNERWIYNDVERGFEQARGTGKPLLVVLRCVPCLGCAGIDAQVLEEADLTPLLDQFVLVRVINANSLDLTKFQFDYDLSFSTLFFNGDGTIYGRYGSWTHQEDPREDSTAGYKKALEGALALHRGYPANRDSLAGKQGGPMPFKTPLGFPALSGKYTERLDWEGQVVKSCVHCHQIGDAFRTYYRDRNQPVPPQLVFPMPEPETLGFSLATDSMARVRDVEPGSPAAEAGLRRGDEIVFLEGQPLLSGADLRWVLHTAPESGDLTATVRRAGKQGELTIQLPEGWRSHSDISRRVGTWPMRAMALGGLKLEDLSDDERRRRGLEADELALEAVHVGQYNKHAAAKRAGFQKGDILVEVDGFSEHMTEGQLIGKLLETRQPGEKAKTTVLRGNRRLELALPMQ